MESNVEKKVYLLNHPIHIYLLALYFLLSPIEFALNNLTGGSSLKYIGALLIVTMLIHSFRNRKKIIIKEYHIFLMMWLIVVIASVIWTVSTSTAQMYISSYISIILFYIIVTIHTYRKEQIKLFLTSIYLGSLLVVFLTIFFSESYGESARNVISLFGSNFEPNNLAAFIAFSATFSFWYIFKTNNKSMKLFYLAMLLLTIIALFHTGSRGGFVTIVVSIFTVYIGYNLVEKHSNLKAKITISSVIFVVFMLIPYILNEFLDPYLIERIFNFDTYVGGSQRVALWNYGLELFLNNPLLGYGLGSYLALTSKVLHNTYFTVIFETGIIGSFLFLSFLLSLFWRILKNKKLIILGILLTGLVSAFFVDAMIKRFFWNAIIIATIMINYNTEHEET